MFAVSSIKRSREASQESDYVATSPKVTTPEKFDIPRLSGLFDYLDFFSGPIFSININKL